MIERARDAGGSAGSLHRTGVRFGVSPGRLIAIAVLAALPGVAPAQAPAPFAAFDRASDPVLNDPHDLTVGPDGRLYVADKLGARIAVMDAETLELVEVIGAGRFPEIRDISFRPDGATVLAVTGLGQALEIAAVDVPEPMVTAAVPAPRTEGALAHSSGAIVAVSSATGEIVRRDPDGTMTRADAQLWGAHDIAEAPDGSLWIADTRGRRLVRVSLDFTVLGVLDHPKFGFVGPRYLDVDPAGRLVVADQDAHRILLIDPAGSDGGTLIGVLGDGLPGEGPGKFDDPEGVAVDGSRYYISDSDNNRVVRYSVVTN